MRVRSGAAVPASSTPGTYRGSSTTSQTSDLDSSKVATRIKNSSVQLSPNMMTSLVLVISLSWFLPATKGEAVILSLDLLKRCGMCHVGGQLD